ncbi:MAG: DUF1643 domain-containing protein [Eubacteriales bacterium]|nr:DUF1643 domain-containing protein [Eubacteriales bacterium]
MHIPAATIHSQQPLSFEEALKAPAQGFDTQRWLYIPPLYDEYRYVLGTAGEQPLICVGLNPSTAQPGALDNTLKSVQRVAASNGFDSFLMMNLYAQRATRPYDMDREVCDFLHRENLKAFRYLLGKAKTVWAAWGAVMETRGYLAACMADFVKEGQRLGARWYTAGKKSKKGHPHHPLYLRKDSPLEPFNVNAYLAELEG